MILTASKPVNVRIGSPSVNAPNPSFLIPGDKISVKSRVIGDKVNGNNKWVISDKNEFFSEEGFHTTQEIISAPLYSHTDNGSILFKDLGLEELWVYSRGEKVTVILLDSGFSTCPDISSTVLKKSIINDNGEDEIGHGSLMCSIIAGSGSEIVGVAPNCSLISIKFLRSKQANDIRWEDFIQALKKIEEVVNKTEIFIVNCSCAGLLQDNEKIEKIQFLVNYYTINYKILFVCAVGNDSDYVNDIKITPARLKNVISVAGLDKDGRRLISSNYWKGIDLTCLGSFTSAFFQTKYPNYENSGSSHACAFASGLLALFLSKAKANHSDLSFEKLKQIIVDATDLTSETNNQNLLDFILNKQKLLQTFKSI